MSSESSDFHATNPLGSEIETAVPGWNVLTKNFLDSTITDTFSVLLSDYIPNSEQNMEMVAA